MATDTTFGLNETCTVLLGSANHSCSLPASASVLFGAPHCSRLLSQDSCPGFGEPQLLSPGPFPLDLHPTTMNSCSGFGERRCCPPRPLTCSPGANHNFTQHPLQKRRHSYMLSAPTCTCTPTFYIKAALPNLTGPAECAQRLNNLFC